jgi:hypothetical protein
MSSQSKNNDGEDGLNSAKDIEYRKVEFRHCV